MDFLRRRLVPTARRYLEGIRFPIHKRELVAQLERNGVPGPILNQVCSRLPEREYRGPQDVLDALRGGGRH